MPVPIFIILWLSSAILTYMLIRQVYWMRKWSWTYTRGLLVAFFALGTGPIGTVFAFLINVINDDKLER